MRDWEGLSFKIPFLPPSVNSLYGVSVRRGRVKMFLKTESRQFKEKAKLFMPPQKFDEEDLLTVSIKVHTAWRHANGVIKRKDIMNLDKIVCDALAEKYLGTHDEKIWERTIKKVESRENFIIINLKLFVFNIIF